MKRIGKRLIKWFLHAVSEWLEVILTFIFAATLVALLALFLVSFGAIAYSFVLLFTGHFLTGFHLLIISFITSVLLSQLFLKALRV